MNIIKNYSLSIVLLILFLLSWAGQAYFQWEEFVEEQKEHGQEARTNDFPAPFLSATFENWQSEFLQLFTFVVLATYLIHKDSPQSRDSNDKMMALIQEINRKLDKRKTIKRAG